MTENIAEQLGRWGAPIFEELDLVLYDVEVASSRVLVMVDRPGGVGLDVIARCTRALSAVLDEHDPIAGRYTLEVSSPGLERRLRTVEHRRGAIGETVKCKARDPRGVTWRARGVLVDVDDRAMTIETDDGPVTVPHDEVTSARTVFVWPVPSKPKGQGRKKPATAAATEQHRQGSPVTEGNVRKATP